MNSDLKCFAVKVSKFTKPFEFNAGKINLMKKLARKMVPEAFTPFLCALIFTCSLPHLSKERIFLFTGSKYKLV